MTDTDSPPDLTAPEPIQEILTGMEHDDLRTLSRDLTDEHDLIHAESADGSLFAPASESPPSSAVRVAAICRDIADLLADD
ncbi:hypothetical protein [Halalkalicoccus tibetensis]|uniref:Uncharacterized protein n=1 Tax=Halalkalicoccus tibetensis TaxID=175632 RepID=A0ABD5V4P9_9EURY